MHLRFVRSAILPTLLCVLPLQSLAGQNAGAPAARASRDASGRAQRRVVPNADGSRRVTFIEYWPGGALPRRIFDLELGREGRPKARTLRAFDDRGRLLERREVVIGEGGVERGTGTRYVRELSGRTREVSWPIEPEAKNLLGAKK